MNKKYALISLIVIATAILVALIVVGVTKEPVDVKPDVSSVNGEVTLKSQEGNYSVNVTAVYDTMPLTSVTEFPSAERVAVVVYEYTNDDIAHGLSIGNTHFKAYDSNGKELEQFPQEGLFEAGEVGAEGTFTASVAFALNNDKNYIKVEFYNDTASDKPDAVFEKNW